MKPPMKIVRVAISAEAHAKLVRDCRKTARTRGGAIEDAILNYKPKN